MKRILILLVGVILLVSCNTKESLVFVEETEFDYDLGFDYCKLVDSVDGYKVKDFERFDNEINIKSIGTVYCNTERVKGQSGEVDITFLFNEKEYVKTITFIKSKNPYFEDVERVYKLDRSNSKQLKDFETMLSNIKAYDYKDKEIEVSIENKLDIAKLGEQKIRLKATDNDKRSNELEILVKLFDSDKEQPTEPTTPVPEPIVPPTEPTPPQPSGEQFFSINDYDTFDDVMNACHVYISGSNGSCTPVKEDGIWVGYKGIIK